MDCPNCKEPVEPGAAFCGNCGQALTAIPAPQSNTIKTAYETASQTSAAPVPLGDPLAAGTTPLYTQVQAGRAAAGNKSVVALVIGVLGIVCAVFVMALIGLILGIIGVVLGTTARSHQKSILNMLSIVFASIALVISIGVWVINSAELYKQGAVTRSTPATSTSTAATGTSADTPCYTTGFATSLTIVTTSSSCNMQAFEGESFTTSNNVYQVYGDSVAQLTAGSFTELSKTAIEKDFAENLQQYKIVSQSATQFAGSPAYIVTGSDGTHAVVEATVYHATAQGNNVFTIVHGLVGDTINLSELESGWQWK